MKNGWHKERAIEMADSRIINYSGKTLCGNYRSPLERCETAAQAIRLYKNCISWALLERYPTKDDLLRFASKETLAENGVYVDMTFDGERIDGHICCVFLGCKGKVSAGLNVAKKIIPMLYLSEGSDLEVETDGFLHKPISVELYYGSSVRAADGSRLDIRDFNGLGKEDNNGFDSEALAVDPNIDNVEL